MTAGGARIRNRRVPENAEEHIVSKGRLEPGKMFLVDMAGRIIRRRGNQEVPRVPASVPSVGRRQHRRDGQLPKREHVNHSGQSVQRRQRVFGYTEEDAKLLLARWPTPARSRSDPWAMTRLWPRFPPAARGMLFDYFARSSRRSPTRRSTGSVKRS